MDAIQIIKVALAVITDRLITVLALLTSFSLGCWTMAEPTWERVCTLAIYVVFGYLVVIAKEKSHGHDSKG